ncbi:MAG: 30S ribosomal protein S3 [Nanoarchaeota archaeon]|nr:30S ribosomal protein S3 [Nanoarchaeota archaeon]
MIERRIVDEKLKEFQIQEYITQHLRNMGHSHIKLQKTPLGDKIIIYAARPGLIVGRKGQTINLLTANLKKTFNLENPQIEINEVENVNLDAQIVAERIANSLEKFGSARFKGIGHRVLTDAMNSGALGIEVIISGKVPSSRAKRWRFYQGYLKKCGEIAITGVHVAYAAAHLKTGTVGIQVRIMPPETKLPDDVQLLDTPINIVEEKELEEKKEEKKEEKSKKKKAVPKKTVVKKEEKEEKPEKQVELKS